MSGVLGDVQVEVYADLTKLAADFKKGEAMAKSFDDKTQKIMGDSAAKNARASSALAQANDRLASTYGNVSKAAQAYERDLADIDRLQKANMITSQQAAAYNQRASAAFAQSSKDAEKSANFAAKAAGYVAAAGVALAGAAIAGFIGAANGAMKAASELDNLSKKLGIGVEELQKWVYVGKEFGLSAGEVASAFEGLDKSLSKAATGAAKEVKLFELLGVELRNAGGEAKTSSEIMPELVDALKNVGDANERAAAEMMLFGAAGAGIDAMVMAGSEGINQLATAAENLGIVLSADEIKNLAESNKSFEEMSQILSADISRFVANNASEIRGLSQDLLSFADACLKAISGFSSFLNSLDANAARLEQGVARTLAAISAASGNTLGAKQLNDYADSKSRIFANSQQSDQGFANKKRGRLDLSGMKKTKGGTSLASLNAPKPRKAGAGRKGPKGPDPERKRIKQLQAAQAFENQLLVFRASLLRAVSGQSEDAILRADIERQLLEMEAKKFEGMLKLEGPEGTKKYTAAQVEQLRAAYKLVELEQGKIVDAELAETQRKEMADLNASRLDNERDILEYAADSADNYKGRAKAELALLDLQHQMEAAVLKGVIASNESSATEVKIAKERLVHLGVLKKLQVKEIEKANRGPMADFMASLNKTPGQLQEAFERIDVSKLEDARNRSVQMADDISEAFANTARSIINLEDPMSIVKNLLTDLASTFTEETIIRPIKEFALKNIGRPLAEQATGAPAGPEMLWAKTMELNANAASTQINAMAMAATRASQALLATANGGILPLQTGAAEAGAELSATTPDISAFGSGLMGVLSQLGGGGGGGLASFLGFAAQIAGSQLGGLGGAGGASSGLSATLASSGGKVGAIGGLKGPGFAKGGRTPRRTPFRVGEEGVEAMWSDANHFISTNRQTMELERRMERLGAGVPSGRQPSFTGREMTGARGGNKNYRFGDIVLPGITDERAGRRVGKQVAASIRGDMARSSMHGYGSTK